MFMVSFCCIIKPNFNDIFSSCVNLITAILHVYGVHLTTSCSHCALTILVKLVSYACILAQDICCSVHVASIATCIERPPQCLRFKYSLQLTLRGRYSCSPVSVGYNKKFLQDVIRYPYTEQKLYLPLITQQLSAWLSAQLLWLLKLTNIPIFEGHCYGCRNNGYVGMKHPNNDAYSGGHLDGYLPFGVNSYARNNDEELSV